MTKGGCYMPKNSPLMLDVNKPPKVLLLGNGLLRLAGGGDWSALLQQLTERPEEINLHGVPYAMQPEALCGTDVEEVQRRAARTIENSRVHPLLAELLHMDFDAILTTNFTYEIEETLTGRPWGEYQRRKAFCALDGKTGVRHNTCTCNLVQRADGRCIPVFHIHGEKGRKHSLVLSYYSYAKSVSKLCEFNQQRGNLYQESQQEGKSVVVQSWLDYFLMGDVYAVGLGFDTSEFDLWWAIERKAREKAAHGKLYACMSEKRDKHLPQEALFRAMQVDGERFDATDGYEGAYARIVEQIRSRMNAASRSQEEC